MKSMDVIAGRYLVVKGPAEDQTLKGGFGVVYLCADQHDEGRPVALKTFQPQFLSDRAARDRFLREGDIWVRLGRHPSIVRAHGVIRVADGREVYVVMDWVAAADGKRRASLREWLTPRRPVDTTRALGWALQIVRAMKHATAIVTGFVHRDLKPENVLVGRDGRARVTDFGLARMATKTDTADVPTGETGTGTASARNVHPTAGAAGTWPYMAPEQFDGRGVDLRADVYALGCLVVEMLIGEMPVSTASRDIQAYRALHRSGRALEAAETLSADLQQWLERCVAVRATGRFSNWNDVEAALIDTHTRVTGMSAPAIPTDEQQTRAERLAAGSSLTSIGHSYVDLGMYDKASTYFERAKGIGVAEGARDLEGASLGNLGVTHLGLGNALDAIACFEQDLMIARELVDRRGEGITHGNLGEAYTILGKSSAAMAHLEQSLAIARELSDRSGEGVALSGLGRAHYEHGDSRLAIEYFEKSLAIARETGDRTAEGERLGKLGVAAANLGNPRKAIEYHGRHLDVCRQLGNRSGEGMALGNLGIAWQALGETQSAIEYHEQNLEISREIGDRAAEGRALGNLGIAYRKLGDPRRALMYHELNLQISRDVGDKAAEGRALGNVANAYADMDEVDRAVEYQEARLAIARDIGDRPGEARSSFNLAGLCARQHQLPRARGLAQAAAAVFRRLGHHQEAEQAERLVAYLDDAIGEERER